MKVGELSLYIFIIVLMGSNLVYELFFLKEINYNRISKYISIIFTSIVVIKYILIRRRKLERYELCFLKGVFVNDRRSYRKVLNAVDSFYSKRYKKTIQKLEELECKCITNKDKAAVRLIRAMCYHEEKKYEEAISLYERILGIDITNAYVWAYLGRAYDNIQKRDSALQAYGNALLYQPDNAVVHCSLAYHYMEDLDLQEAYQYARKTIEIESCRNDPAVILALNFAYRGREDIAMKFYHCYHGEKKKERKLKKWIKDICKNKRKPDLAYCGNIREFQHLFLL